MLESHEVLEETIRRDTVRVAKACGLSPSQVNKWKEPFGNEYDSGSYNPLDRIICIMKTIRELHPDDPRYIIPLKWLAREFGFALVPLPKGGGDLADITKNLLSIIKEFGELTGKSSGALQDGRITKKEARSIMAEGHELQDALARFMSSVKAKVK